MKDFSKSIINVLLGLSKDTIDETAKKINDIKNFDNEKISVLIDYFISFIKGRYRNKRDFATLIMQINVFKDQSNKKFFISVVKKKVGESDNEVLCEFLYDLVCVNFFDIKTIFEILESIFNTTKQVPNDILIQSMFTLFNLGKQLFTDDEQRLNNIWSNYDKRIQINNKEEYMLDMNSPLFSSHYDTLTTIKNNGWCVPTSIENSELIKAIKEDNLDSLINVIKKMEIGDDFTVAPSLMLSYSILSFAPTVIHLVAFFDAVKCFNYLIDEGWDYKSVDEMECNILCYAAAGGSVRIVNTLLDKLKFDSYYQCLNYAITNWNMDIYNTIKSKIKDIQSHLEKSDHFTHAAAKTNNVVAMEKFKEEGISLSTFDDYGWLPIHIAAAYNSAEVLQQLIDFGEDINKCDLEDLSCLSIAAKDSNIRAMNVLLECKSFNTELQDNKGARAIHWATISNQVEALNLLLSSPRIDPTSRDLFKMNALQLSVIQGCPDTFKVLFNNDKLNKNEVDFQGNTLLHAVGISGDAEICKVLLDSKLFDPNKKNNDGRTPADIAALGNKTSVLNLLKSAQTKI